MADLIIKPATGDGNKLILQDKAGSAILTSGDTQAESTLQIGDLVASSPLSHRNFFINGGFDVWQRGTSLAGATSFLADRWFNATTETQTRQTFDVGQTDVTGSPTYYHRGAGGSTEWYELRQKIENVRITGGQTVTLSYWMKGSGTFTNAPYLNQNFGPGGASSGEVSLALATHSVTTSWVRYSQTIAVPSISGKTLNSNPATTYTQISLVRANNNNITVDVANCQLELGSNATPFEHRSYGEELARCERYYEKIYDASEPSSQEARIGTGVFWKGDQLQVIAPFRTRKRANPTFEEIEGTDYYKADRYGSEKLINAIGSDANGNSQDRFSVWISGGGFSDTIGNVWEMRTNNALARGAFSAEL